MSLGSSVQTPPILNVRPNKKIRVVTLHYLSGQTRCHVPVYTVQDFLSRCMLVAFQSSFSASLACEPGHGKLCNPRCLCLLATPWVPMMNQEQLKVDLPLSLAAFQIIQLGSWTVP